MKKILYIIDDINFESGARKVTEYQMLLLSNQFEISVFSLKEPETDIKNRLCFIKFIGQDIWEKTELLALSFKSVFKSNKFNIKQKCTRILYSLGMRLHLDSKFIDMYINDDLKELFNSYDTVIVVSESSKLRQVISELKYPQKIQWIHTDYALWSEFSEWTKKMTYDDAKLYLNYNIIVTLSEKCKKGFIAKYPNLKDKTIVIPNLIPIDEILHKSKEHLEIDINKNITNIVTVGRIDKEKAYDRIIRICKRLKEEDFKFHWYIVGDGPLSEYIESYIKENELEDQISLLGRVSNPYPIIKNCDIFALLSIYEGLPVTIQEAITLGTPVIATDVGGISNLIDDGNTGILVKNNESDIYSAIKYLLSNKSLLNRFQNNLKMYHNNNDEILQMIRQLL